MDYENIYHLAEHAVELLSRGDDFQEANAVRALIADHKAMRQAMQNDCPNWPACPCNAKADCNYKGPV